MKILITGGNGYIGKSLYNHLKDEFNVTSISRKDFDLTNSEAVKLFFHDKYFDVVIHCAVVGGKRTDIDNVDVLDKNLKIYYNLLDCKEHFNKFIHFGSGAEEHNSFYGVSKNVINKSIYYHDNFYNLRIYAVFDENELDTRFIKTNIKKYINKQSIEIFKNKYMDFIYMNDLVTLVKYYINNNNLPKEINCNYNYTLTLLEIANLINNLDDYSVPIILQHSVIDTAYVGKFIDLGINFIGLKQGIINVFEKLK
jgi:UDP-glucose 4-epimerase